MLKLIGSCIFISLLNPTHTQSVSGSRGRDAHVYEISFRISVSDDEVIIGEPMICLEGSHPIECHCEDPAVNISIKKDKMESLCRKHYKESVGANIKSPEYVRKEAIKKYEKK